MSWDALLDTNINGGVGNSDMTPGDCLLTCVNDIHCSGVDWTIVDPAGKCFVFGPNTGQPQPKPDVTHYNIIRNANCTGTFV